MNSEGVLLFCQSPIQYNINLWCNYDQVTIPDMSSGAAAKLAIAASMSVSGFSPPGADWISHWGTGLHKLCGQRVPELSIAARITSLSTATFWFLKKTLADERSTTS